MNVLFHDRPDIDELEDALLCAYYYEWQSCIFNVY